MRSAFNQATVFARHHFTWIHLRAAKVLVSDSRAELTQNARQLTRLNACVKLDSKVTHWRAAFQLTNALRVLVPMVPNVQIKKAVTSVRVPKE